MTNPSTDPPPFPGPATGAAARQSYRRLARRASVRSALWVPGSAPTPARPPDLDLYDVLLDPEHPAFADLGRLLWTLVATQWSWVDRRVDNVELSGERSIRRHMSIDCRVPPPVTDLADEVGFGRFFVPLRFVTTKQLLAFDLRLGDRSVPLLTRHQSAMAANAVLRAAIEQAELEITPDVVAAIERVAADDDPGAEAALQLLELTEPGRVGVDATPAELAHWAVTTFDANYLLLADVGLGELRRRTIFKITQEVGPALREAHGLPLRSGIALQPTSFVFDAPSVTSTSSYHFQFDAPDGLVIAGGELFGAVADDPQRRSFGTSGTQGSVLGLHANNDDVPVADAYSAEVLVRPSPDGLLRSSAVSSTFSTVLLFLAASLAHRISLSNLDDSTALLLVLPGVVSTFLARPGEHYWVSRILRGVRALTLTNAIAVYIAAAAPVTGVADDSVQAVWLACALVSLVPTTLLLTATRRGRPRGWS
ncbi:MAG TPA: hypothetical protein VK611_05540 [Acidimicrobiales bacterium]|nr:hypothetical protein [Acidimicrobiales bacterium]